MSEYVSIVIGDNYHTWLLGAVERMKSREWADRQLPERLPEDIVLGEATMLARDYCYGVMALQKEATAKYREVEASNLKSHHDAFQRDVVLYIQPGMQILQQLAGAQLRMDVANIPAEHRDKILMLTQGGTVVGIKNMRELAARTGAMSAMIVEV